MRDTTLEDARMTTDFEFNETINQVNLLVSEVKDLTDKVLQLESEVKTFIQKLSEYKSTL